MIKLAKQTPKPHKNLFLSLILIFTEFVFYAINDMIQPDVGTDAETYCDGIFLKSVATDVDSLNFSFRLFYNDVLSIMNLRYSK